MFEVSETAKISGRFYASKEIIQQNSWIWMKYFFQVEQILAGSDISLSTNYLFAAILG